MFDGEIAINFIHDIDSRPANYPDLIILDLNLPKKPGHEVLECIRASAKCNQSPVVILTSSDDRQDRDESLRLGASQYLRKPLRLEEFIGLGAVFKALLAARSGR